MSATKHAWTIEMPYLPDLALVGGNARHGHWASRYRASRAEKDAWLYAIRFCQIPPYPRFLSAHAKVTLVFKQHRGRDIQDNVSVALKPLWDSLVFLDILVNDCPPFLYVAPIEVEVSPERAPLTILTLEGDLAK